MYSDREALIFNRICTNCQPTKNVFISIQQIVSFYVFVLGQILHLFCKFCLNQNRKTHEIHMQLPQSKHFPPNIFHLMMIFMGTLTPNSRSRKIFTVLITYSRSSLEIVIKSNCRTSFCEINWRTFDGCEM